MHINEHIEVDRQFADFTPSDFALRSNSIATNFRAMDGTFVFNRPCSCEHDWSRGFCSRLVAYERMSSDKAPSICICRQLDGFRSGCAQVLTRCFWNPLRSLRSPRSQRLSSVKSKNQVTRSCSCCFNQPDQHCQQLDCSHLKPNFGPDTNTTCICYRPNNYPKSVCHPTSTNKQNSTGGGQLAKSLALTDDDANKIQQQMWPFAENVVFMEKENSAEYQTNDQTSRDFRSDFQSSFFGNDLMIPILLVIIVVGLTLMMIVCVFFLVNRVRIKTHQSNSKTQTRRSASPVHGGSIQRAIFQQNASMNNNRRSLSANSKTPVNRLLQPHDEIIAIAKNEETFTSSDFSNHCKKGTTFV
ncbi:hypothetical protein M3Y96_00817400 [Aphelenchoides besseyi]|nr:hypothetical protein M3Y96_00817400 [Aphelenchoides besseyi]